MYILDSQKKYIKITYAQISFQFYVNLSNLPKFFFNFAQI